MLKRRDFIKSLLSIPFVGSLVARLAPGPALGVPEEIPGYNCDWLRCWDRLGKKIVNRK